MDILHCFLCIFLHYSKTYFSAAVELIYCIFVTLWIFKLNKRQSICFNPIVFFSSPAFHLFSFILRIVYSVSAEHCSRALCVCVSVCAVKQLMAFVNPPKQKKPQSDLPSCSAISRHLWNRLSLLFTWPGTHFSGALSTGNTGGRAESLCYSNPALVISQLMSSPCYLSLEIHGFGAAAVVAAIF